MKKIVLTALLAATLHTCFAQKLTMDKVPVAVAATFKSMFPNGSQPSWEKEENNTYEVDFFNGKKPQSATFDSTGAWLETEVEINYSQLPAKVKRAFESEFGDYQVHEVTKEEKPANTLHYEITCFKGKENYELLYSTTGELLLKEKGD